MVADVEQAVKEPGKTKGGEGDKLTEVGQEQETVAKAGRAVEELEKDGGRGEEGVEPNQQFHEEEVRGVRGDENKNKKSEVGQEEVRVGRGLETGNEKIKADDDERSCKADEAGHKVSWIEYCVVKVLFELKIFEEFRVFCPRNSFRKLTIQLEWKERKDQCVK